MINLLSLLNGRGGDISIFDDCKSLKKADYTVDITADKEGYVHHIQSELIGEASMILGGGRQNKEDKIDHYVGVVLSKKVGDAVKEGDVIATIYANDKKKIDDAKALIVKAFDINNQIVNTYTLIKRIISCKKCLNDVIIISKRIIDVSGRIFFVSDIIII